MKSMSKWLVVLALVVLAANAFAVPASSRRQIVFNQPDGSTFSGILKGDEYFGFAETQSGFSAVCGKDGWWTYAQLKDGLLVPSNAKVGKDAPPYREHLRPNAEAILNMPKNKSRIPANLGDIRHKRSTDVLYGVGGTKEKTTINNSKAPSGKRMINILLANFTDSSFSYFSGKANPPTWPPMPQSIYRHCLTIALGDKDSAKPVLYDSSTVPSLSNYYYDMTLNKMYFASDYSGAQIMGVDTIRATTYTWASANSGDINYMTQAATNADPYVNFRDPATGGQTAIGVVHPGPCETESGRTGDIWSFSYDGFNVATDDGVTISGMFIVPQGVMLGVFAHECYHNLGGPDLYDYGYSGTPWGEWSLMDGGASNGPLMGDKPSFVGGHLMYDLDGNITNGVDGWLTASAVGNCDSISSAYRGDGEYTVAVMDSAGEARRGVYTTGKRLWRIRNNAFRDSSQMFLVELRQRTPPYEEGLSEEGILITHIDTRMAGASPNFNGGPPCLRAYYSWVESPGVNPNVAYAALDTNYNRQTATAAYSADDISAGGYSEIAVDSVTIPNCLVNAGLTPALNTRSGPWIYDISREGPTMTFKVARTGLAATTPQVSFQSALVLDPVINFTANNNNGILDPWETDSVKVTLRNSGAIITAGAQCSLYTVAGTQWAAVANPGWKQVGTGALAAGSGSGQSLPFVITVNKDAPKFTDVVFAAAFKSTTPVYNDIIYFTLRISGLVVLKTYDFVNIAAGGVGYAWRICPSDVAVLADTVFVSDANLDNATFATRVYAVRKNTTNNPLLPADTIRSINNRGTVHVATKYAGGIDIDNSGQLWISLQDSVYSTNRSTTTNTAFRAPGVDWGGTPMLRIRGVGFGPSVVDTVGPDPLSGDSLWTWWQNYEAFSESLLVLSKPASGTAVKRYGYSWNETAYGALYGGQWWNGRGVEYDGSSIWTTSVYANYLMRRSPINGQLIDIMPGPSSYGNYGTYGVAIEATNSVGVPYAPVGTAAYVRGAEGNRFYLYCASMDEAKVYKVDITGLVAATPPDSVKVADTGADNVVSWWKANDNEQKVQMYNVYRQAAGTTYPPVLADRIAQVQNVYGGPVTHTYTDVGAGAKGKAVYVYTVKSGNYYSGGEWGASENSPANAVELTNFAASASDHSVTLQWTTASETDNYEWRIKRSADGVNYQLVATLQAEPAPYGKSYSHTDVVETEGIYHYQLYDVSKNNNERLSGSLIQTVGKIPINYELSQNYPNPVSRGFTKVAFALKNPGKVSLVVYNVLGEQVKTLANDTRKAGFYTVPWDGCDNKGQQVSNGIYFYKLISGEFQSTKKLTVLK